jgi:transposase
MSDAEWRVIEPALPVPAWKAGKGGRPAGRCRRDYVDTIRYLVKEGIQWRAMPADLPHWRTVYDVADGWHKSGATGKMHDELDPPVKGRQQRRPPGERLAQLGWIDSPRAFDPFGHGGLTGLARAGRLDRAFPPSGMGDAERAAAARCGSARPGRRGRPQPAPGDRWPPGSHSAWFGT